MTNICPECGNELISPNAEIPYRETNTLHMVLFVVLWFIGVFVVLAAVVAAFVFGMSGAASY